MRFCKIIICVIWVTSAPTVVGQKLMDPILLWPAGAPGATGDTDEDKPAIIPFVPDVSKRNGAAVLVVPGGGFTIRATDHEGVLVAQWLRDHGITAFLLRYRLRPLYTRTDWLKDGQRGIQYIRAHASEYHINPKHVGAVGFSAGANLIADVAFNSLSGKANSVDLLDRFNTNLDFMILAYGSMQMPATIDPLVLASLPPTFMYGTAEDTGSLKGMIQLYANLFDAKIPVEAHFFRNGEHGTGFAIGDPILGEWPKLMHTWLKVGGFLSDKPKYSISGLVKLDGAPLIRGMVILTPADEPNAPPVVVYITNTGTDELGRFSVSANQGLIAGKYKIEVRQDATRWMSNSRDPFMINMMAKQRDNNLTEEDITQWSKYLRKRDLSPSIFNQRVFQHQHLSDKQDYIIAIKERAELQIEVFSK